MSNINRLNNVNYKLTQNHKMGGGCLSYYK